MSDTARAQGFGLATLITVVFVTLKLTDQIDWAWGWVVSPLWINFGLALLVLGAYALVDLFGNNKPS